MLEKTDLTDFQKVQLAAAAVAHQGEFGAISDLADQYGISRNTVYDIKDKTHDILEQHVVHDDATPMGWVPIDHNQITRAIIALRVVAPDSLRDIEELIPIIYPGFKLSYGSIQAIAAQAEVRAAQRNTQADLSPITAGALDEMFSQGDPVLAGVDLDAGFLFLLALRAQRAGEDWADELDRCRQQGLDLKVVVKDAALGIEAGVREVFPDAEQRDDCFHALYEMGKLKRQLEQRAYGAISRVEELEAKIDKLKYQGKAKKRQQLAQQLRWERQRCDEAIELFDQFEAAQMQATEAMEVVDLERGILRDSSWMQAEMQAAAATMLDMDSDKCRKVGRYIHNRAPGLSLYAQQMNVELTEVASRHGQHAMILACILVRLLGQLDSRRRSWCRRQDRQQFLGAYAALKQMAGPNTDNILSEVEQVFIHRYRASSAIEGFNAALRPYLYVHKGVTQGFLELFRFYYNHRQRRWGRHKGTSAHEAMTGETVDDWLTWLGYPPNSQLLN